MSQEKEDELLWLAVSDVKQFFYCPRIVYYCYCTPGIRPTTYKMEVSRLAHQEEEEREARRSLHSYGIRDGRRYFDVRVSSARLGLSGKIDMVIETEETGQAELIPVDYKGTTWRAGRHVKAQLAGYALLLEERWGKPVRRGFVFSLMRRRAEEIQLGEGLRREVICALAAMRQMVRTEQMPRPTARRRRCRNCEFRLFCNDV